ncbi:MAG: large subunit ribosomal protein [Chthoniobacter sp.]|jgi:large subunit ribosomal protein L28|nr:large subunit ribosomal protein [Chthoniobacter sp.]
MPEFVKNETSFSSSCSSSKTRDENENEDEQPSIHPGSARDFPLTTLKSATIVAAPLGEFLMKVCSITNAKPAKGSRIHRRGLAKKKGGIGQHVTKVVSRSFEPNLKNKRIWVSELKRFVSVKLTARALKTVTKNGAYATLKVAGLI